MVARRFQQLPAGRRDNVDPKLNPWASDRALDAIQEFEVLTSTPEASFGRQAASQIAWSSSRDDRVGGTAYTSSGMVRWTPRNYFAPKTEPAPSINEPIRIFAGGQSCVTGHLLYDYEGNASGRRYHSRHDRADRGRAHIGSLPAFLTHPVGRAIAALYPSPNRPGASGNYVRRPHNAITRIISTCGATPAFSPSLDVALRYSFADRRLFEPFSGPRFPRARLRQRCRAARAECRRQCNAYRVADALHETEPH